MAWSFLAGDVDANDLKDNLRIRWLGHAGFRISFNDP